MFLLELIKKKIFNCYLYVLHIFVFISCYLNSPKLCSYLIKISLFRKKSLNKKVTSKKITLVLYRDIGERDIRIVQKSSNRIPQIFFMRRSLTKLIFYFFSGKRKIFFNYLKPGLYFDEKEYFNQNKEYQMKLEIFWTKVIFNLKKLYKDKNLELITFNCNYYAEISLYAGCNKNNLPVKLWLKECFRSDPATEYFIKKNRYGHIFKYFQKISVYNKSMKNALIEVNKSNSKKISVNGCPRILDFIIKEKYSKKVKDILFLSFHNKSGIPPNKQNEKYNWNKSYDKTIKILNKLSNNKNLNIVIKRKKNSTYKPKLKISKNIKVYDSGTAQKYINEADIIIGQNSASTIEALINGKHVLVPFFEKKKILKKYLYNFDKKIIFNSEKKLKKHILSLIDKKNIFPLKNSKNQKTIHSYYGSSKNVIKNYEIFLNS
ncbi:hypothetical protein OAN07_01705 [Candidatus Pelagibacter sp.]|nr:hypothetical protein [Candidatus Pelagibacter sp.]